MESRDLIYRLSAFSPLSLVLVIILVTYLFITQRRNVVFLFVAGIITFPMAMGIFVGGFDFTTLRIMILGICLRSILRNETHGFKWDNIDTMYTLFVLFKGIIFLIATNDFTVITTIMGWFYTELGIYFVFRIYIRNKNEIFYFMKLLIYYSIIILALFIIESVTRFNPFSILGGTVETVVIRSGETRVRGAFTHPIIAGTFWAAFIPLAFSLYYSGKDEMKRIGILGIISFSLLTFFPHSSTPLMLLVAGMFGLILYKFWRYKNKFLLYILIIYFLLSLIMSNPPYHLIGRVSSFVSGTGWHRYNLIHQGILHFHQWFLLGMGKVSTEVWGWGLWDVTNEYIAIGITGGAGALAIFIIMIMQIYKKISIDFDKVSTELERRMIWGIGVMMFVHNVGFVVISYFGQLQILVPLTIAIVIAISNTINNSLRMEKKLK